MIGARSVFPNWRVKFQLSYPIGFFDCQAQVSRHMSSRVYSAFQPRSCALLSGLE